MNDAIRKSLKRSVLCWLATSSADNTPNVSPKEVFAPYGDDGLIIANIASPNSVRNIRKNAKVCVSFIDIFVQKGFQLKGIAEIVKIDQTAYDDMRNRLEELTLGKYPFNTIIHIKVESTKPIIAPSYLLYPDTKEIDQIHSAKATYLQHLNE